LENLKGGLVFSTIFTWQLRLLRNIRRDPSDLIFAELLGCRSPAESHDEKVWRYFGRPALARSGPILGRSSSLPILAQSGHYS
jgi:hypothetical protein